MVYKGTKLQFSSVKYNEEGTTLEYIISKQNQRDIRWYDDQYGGCYISLAFEEELDTVFDCSDSGTVLKAYYYVEDNDNINPYPIDIVINISRKTLNEPFALTGYSYTGKPITPKIKHNEDNYENYYSIVYSDEPAITAGEHVIATAILKDKVNYQWGTYKEDPTEDYEIVFEIFKTKIDYFTLNGEKVQNNTATYNLSDVSAGLTFGAVIYTWIEDPVDIACSGFSQAIFAIDEQTTAECEMNDKSLIVTSAGTIVINISVPATDNCAAKESTITIIINDN